MLKVLIFSGRCIVAGFFLFVALLSTTPIIIALVLAVLALFLMCKLGGVVR